MKDRVPTYPGRIKLIPVDTGNGIYDIQRMDEPVESGTPLNKENLLSDTVSQEIFGDTEDHTVSEALLSLRNADADIVFKKIGEYEVNGSLESYSGYYNTSKEIFGINLDDVLLSKKLVLVTVKKGLYVSGYNNYENSSRGIGLAICNGSYNQYGSLPDLVTLASSSTGTLSAELDNDASLLFNVHGGYYYVSGSRSFTNPVSICVTGTGGSNNSASFSNITVTGIMEVYAL